MTLAPSSLLGKMEPAGFPRPHLQEETESGTDGGPWPLWSQARHRVLRMGSLILLILGDCLSLQKT